MKWFYIFLREAVRIYYNICYKIRLEGKENIPKTGGFILASNHAYAGDPMWLSFGTPRMIRYLSKAELCDNKWYGIYFRAIGTVAVDRGSGGAEAVNECAEIIADGGILGIFPEGTRNHAEGFLRPKSGMSVIAKITKADILPCAVIAPPNLKRGQTIIIKYGKLIPYEALNIEEDSPRSLKAATRQVWDEIISLAGGENQNEK
ncbi:MAG: lysophospholipid acyltransferase family protein [Oscillospiraceae bacterium]